MSITEMTSKVKELKSLQTLIEEAEAEAEALKKTKSKPPWATAKKSE